jgi:hypothetical protein
MRKNSRINMRIRKDKIEKRSRGEITNTNNSLFITFL